MEDHTGGQMAMTPFKNKHKFKLTSFQTNILIGITIVGSSGHPLKVQTDLRSIVERRTLNQAFGQDPVRDSHRHLKLCGMIHPLRIV